MPPQQNISALHNNRGETAAEYHRICEFDECLRDSGLNEKVRALFVDSRHVTLTCELRTICTF